MQMQRSKHQPVREPLQRAVAAYSTTRTPCACRERAASVRSNSAVKPQQGISFILLEMNSPGISVQPVVFASGTHEVNQVFFDDVRVPKANRVGEEKKIGEKV